MLGRRGFNASAFAGLVAMALPSAARAQSNAPLRIGVVGPMTGQFAALGAQFRAGAEAAVADLNAAGGVLGRQLVLEVGDDACDPRQAVSVANRMASRRVVFVAGHACSGASLAARPVYGEEGVLMISPGSTSPRFTDEGGWHAFRVCGRDDQQGQVAGGFLARRFAGKRVAVLHDNSAYGRGLAEETLKAMRAGGLTETLFSAYTPGERDYSVVVSRLKSAAVDAVYIGGYHTEAGLILRQAREQGMSDLTLVGGDALVVQEFWAITGAAGEGTLMTFAPDPRTRPSAAEVVARLNARGTEADGYVLYTYAAMQCWAAAAARAGSVEPRRIADTLRQGGPWQTVLGEISFDAKGDVVQPSFVLHAWRNGALVPA
jgi:branched-chain amino acid transport system substrate-binding protein